MSVSLSIVVPTSGRESLQETLYSLCPQLESGDEVIVTRLDCMYGHEARNQAMPRCAGSHLLFIDDDDVCLPEGLAKVRGWVEGAPNYVHLFPMQMDDGRLTMPEWPLRAGAIGTSMFCVPNLPGKLGVWGERYEGDFDFIASTMGLRGDVPQMHSEPIAWIRPLVPF